MPTAKPPKRWERVSQVTFASYVVFANLIFMVSSMIYLRKVISISVEEALYSMFQAAAFADAAYGFVIILFHRQTIKEIFTRLSVIYDECKFN